MAGGRIIAAVAAALMLAGCKMGAEPMDFECGEDMLKDAWRTYEVPLSQQEIQRDAGQDFANDGESQVTATTLERDSLASDPIYRALAGSGLEISSLDANEPERILLLSGGGQWGAFGAGYLNALNKAGKLGKFRVVTGVSTGAIQSLFVAAGDYQGMEDEYRLDKPLVKKRKDSDILGKGSLNDTQPLRDRLEKRLCPDAQCKMIEAIAASGAPRLFIGFVESRTGKFKVVDVSLLAQRAVAIKGRQQGEARRKAAQCIVGVTMASSAVPVEMRPVRFRIGKGDAWRTYVDGGVRLSVFETRVAEIVDAASKGKPIELYVLRNGPTVVRPQRPDEKTGIAPVDGEPNVKNVGLTAYPVLVNQNELTSITGMRQIWPKGPMKVATADGFNTAYDWRPKPHATCEKPTDANLEAFNNPFMNCLATWGADKALRHPLGGWIEVRELKALR